MVTLRKIDEFVPITGDWMHHIERINFLFPAILQKRQRKKAILLSSNGAGTYS